MKLNLKLGAKINLIVLGIVLLLSIVIGVVVVREVTDGIKTFAIEKAKGDLALSERYINNKYPGEWHIDNGKLLKGDESFNDNYEAVDKIGQDTGDTVTIFQGDTRIATNVRVNGDRAVGTKVSHQVADAVLKEGNNYYGQATVAGQTYQTAYMPIKDKNGEAIGILYVGAPQAIIDDILSSFLTIFLILVITIIIIATFIVLWFTRGLTKRLTTISSALENAGYGDFTTTIIDETGDELSDLSKSFNNMKENLSDLIQNVMKSSELVASSSEELTAGAEQTSKATEHITDSIQQIANGSESQTQSVEESARALEELSIGIANIADRSSLLAESGVEASDRAKQGGVYVQETAEQMNTIHSSVNETSHVIKLLDERSKQIGDITNAITDIANQTNLLALNATIEAARAGEHGKGFAVVADEVRKLAEQSQSSANQISELIVQIQNDMTHSNNSMEQVKQEVQNGLGIVSKTQSSFDGILGSMDAMGKQVDEMAATAQQMSASTQEVSATVTGITTISRDSSKHSQSVAASAEEQLASMEEISASATSLSKIASELKNTVSKFKIRNGLTLK
ncbi:methyl-accepting chemotaxis protein [Metabacillus sp. YM-086]|uniref:methyl-accepting chemotaxis protein n=1 Tax=Metabacillus sp. YM-086 TaxID=3341729 RepID=UPI001B9F593D